MKKIFLISFIILTATLVSCNHKKSTKKDILFEVENKLLNKNNILRLNVINNTNNNFFIIIDTNRMYNYSTLDNSINESIHILPLFYLNKDSIKLTVMSQIIKAFGSDSTTINCRNKERLFTKKYISEFKDLKNIIILKKNSKTFLKIPFKTSYFDCSKSFSYLLEKEKEYKVQFKYQMSRQLIEKQISNEKILDLKKKGIEPYYKKIESNKVFFKL